MAAPIRSALPQPSQAYCAVVTSKEKISLREPAAALPSSLSLSSIALTSSGSEAFGLHTRGVVPQSHQRVRHPLHKRGGAAHEGGWTLLRGPGYLPKHLGVDPPVVAGPILRPGARQGVDHLQRTVSCCEIFQLLAEDDLLVGTRGVQQAGGYVAACGRPVADHRHQRRDARTPSNQEERSAISFLPGKIAPDRPPQLQLVSCHQHVGEVN